MKVVVLTDRRYVGDNPEAGPVEGYTDNVVLEDSLVCDALERLVQVEGCRCRVDLPLW